MSSIQYIHPRPQLGEGGGVYIDVASEHLIKCMLKNSQTGFWSEKSVCQQEFGLKNMLAYPTSSLARATLATSMSTPSVEAVGVCIG